MVVADQGPAVSAHDLLEGRIVVLPDEPDQPLVRLCGERPARNRFQGLEIRRLSSSSSFERQSLNFLS